MNILILSCGTRNKIIQYFKKELAGVGQVMAADCSNLAPALYEADKYFIVPNIFHPEYLDSILNICKKNSINAVLSLIDPELSLLAANWTKFLEIGTLPVVSDYSSVEMCFNKYCMHKFLYENGFKTLKSYIDKGEFYNDLEAGEISYPVFIKPYYGSASINTFIVTSNIEVEILFSRYENMMIQEFMNGIEYGIDCYIDMISNEPVAIFAKEKIRMRAGETDKSISVIDMKLFEFIKHFVKEARLRGVIDIDVFKVNNEYYISDVNPRFGGGYPHAYECGVNIPQMIIENLRGNINKNVIGQYKEGTYMMKYSDVMVINID